MFLFQERELGYVRLRDMLVTAESYLACEELHSRPVWWSWLSTATCRLESHSKNCQGPQHLRQFCPLIYFYEGNFSVSTVFFFKSVCFHI